MNDNQDDVLELAIEYAVRGQYPPGLTKDRKRAVWRRATTLQVDKGEVFLKRKGREVKVVTSLLWISGEFWSHVILILPRGISGLPRRGVEWLSDFTGVGCQPKQRSW